MTGFEQTVYNVVRRIPRGKVATYKAVARALGKPHAVRAVGNALNKNHNPSVPCHRIIRSDGYVGGFVRGTAAKNGLLKKEGIAVRNGIVLHQFMIEL